MAIEASDTLVIPKPAYHILRRLTGESRPEVALSLALKDLVRLRLEETRATLAAFEQKYAMPFASFSQKWQSGEIAEAHSFEVEQDYWNWEAAVTELKALEEIAEWLI